MRYSVLSRDARNLARSVAILVVAGTAAGCSSDVMRFEDGLFTGSTQSQRNVAAAPATQAYPGGMGMAQGNIDYSSTGSVSRSGDGIRPRPSGSVGRGGGYSPQPAQQPVYAAPVQPSYPVQSAGMVSRQPAPALAPAVQRQPAPALAPAVASRVDTMPTGSTAAAIAPARRNPAPQASAQVAAQDMFDGWSRAGGTQITVREGETVYNLSKRFGVPVNAILQTNGLRDAGTLSAGQNIVIPTYVYSRTSPVSAPDANPDVANAKSSRGSKTDAPLKAPRPQQAPERLAVLPQSPRPNERQQNLEASTDAAAPARGTGQGTGNVYTVASGDTLSSIARKTGTTTAALKQANGLDGGIIRIGQKLTVPSGDAARVVAVAAPAVEPKTTGSIVPARTEPRAAEAYTPPRQSESIIKEATQEAAVAPDSTGIGRMRWPARGRIVAGFGGSSGGKRSDGIDISVPEGTPVKAAENGVVIYAGDGLKDFGNTVLVRHENGLVTVYGHASSLKVSRGDTVKRGQDIALSGISGNADTPKLHFEVRKDSTPVDPTKYLE